MKFEEIIIELSHNCNLSCIMCGFGRNNNPYNKDKFMPFEKYRTVLNQVAPLTGTIRLNGRGESTIHPDFLPILEYTKETFPHLSINLFSNLSFASPGIINSLKKNKVQLFISLDSPFKEELETIRKGADFSFILKNIELLSDTEVRPFIIFTVQEANINLISDMGTFAFNNNCHIIFNTVRRDKGIEVFQSAVNENLSLIKQQFSDIAEIYKGSCLRYMIPDQMAGFEIYFKEAIQTHGTMKTCPALEKELCILYDGTVTPCNMFNPYIYGNIFESQLQDIWHGSKRLDFLDSYKQYYYCKNCANLGI